MVRIVVEVLLNSLWQGAILVALTWSLLRATRFSNAATRYAVWYATLVALVCLPLAVMGGRIFTAEHSTAEDGVVFSDATPATESVPAGPSQSELRVELPGGQAPVLVFGAWLAIAIGLTGRLARSYRSVVRLKHKSAPLGGIGSAQWTRRTVGLRRSNEISMPMVAGLVKPAILFPEALIGKLSLEERYRIWLHEMGHIRRWDDWTNLGQKLAEAWLFFHPAVHWVGRRLNLEREIACDDWVLSVSGSPKPYAACLTKLVELTSMPAQPFPVPGIGNDRKQVFRRVEMILNRNRNSKPYFSKVIFAATLVVFLAASILFAGMKPIFSVADEHPAAPVSQAESQPAPSPVPPVRPQKERTSNNTESTRQIEESMQRLAEGMRPTQEEISKLAKQIREQVRTQIKPNAQQIQKLTEQIQEQVRISMNPSVEEIRKLAREIASEHKSAKPDEQKIRALQERIQTIEKDRVRQAEERVGAVEQQIRAIEREKIRKAEVQVRELEGKIREMEQKVRLKEQEMRRLEQRMRSEELPLPPAGPKAPAPPAQPEAPTPPAPPVQRMRSEEPPLPPAAPKAPAPSAQPEAPAPPAPQVK